MAKTRAVHIFGEKLKKLITSRKRALAFLAGAITLTAALCVTVYSAMLFLAYTASSASAHTMIITNTPSVSSVTSSISFDRAADKKDIHISIENDCGVPIAHRFMLSYSLPTGTEADNMLAKAMYVYYDDEFVNTLSAICPTPGASGEIDITNLVAANGDGETVLDTHKISFEMHIAADSALYKDKQIDLTITDLALNADESDYIFVSDAAEWMRAVDDINSGLISPTVTVVLSQGISLDKDYEITGPCIIDLHGNKLDMNGHNLTIAAAGRTETVVDAETQTSSQVFTPARITMLSSVHYTAGFAAAPTGSITLNTQLQSKTQ